MGINFHNQKKILLEKIGETEVADKKQPEQPKRTGKRQEPVNKPKGCSSCRRKAKNK